MSGEGRLAGRKVLVTGAASGIGRAIALRFAAEGAALSLLDKQAQLLAEVGEATSAHTLPLDLLGFDALAAAVDEAAGAMGGLDGLVNCAGVAHRAMIEDETLEGINEVLGVNLIAPQLLCAAATPWLRRNPLSAVLNIASGAALLPGGPGRATYAASKGGLISLTRALAKELAPAIRVNVICPGMVDTPMNASVDFQGGGAKAAAYALGRAARPAELAAAALFLISDEASYVTGATWAVDGGRTFH